MGADQLADLAGGLGAGLDGRPHASHVTLDQSRDIRAADLHSAGEMHVGRFEHGVGRLDHSDQALGLDQAQGVAVGCAAVAAERAGWWFAELWPWCQAPSLLGVLEEVAAAAALTKDNTPLRSS